MNPYSVSGFGVWNRSLEVLLADAGPPYTVTSTGYFLAGLKVDGKWIIPWSGVVPSAARYVYISTFLRPSSLNVARSVFDRSVMTVPVPGPVASTSRVTGG